MSRFARGCKLRGPSSHEGIKLSASDAGKISFPRSVDQRGTFDVIYDQGNLGSCVANAAGGGCQQRMAMQGLPTMQPARLPIYRAALERDGTFPNDDGTYPETVLAILSEVGFADEKMAPYADTPEALKRATSVEYRRAAARTRLVAWSPIAHDHNTIRFELLSGNSVIVSMLLRQSFETVKSDGIVPLPSRHEEELGGHEMRCVGYDESYLIVANSWGRGWGERGYCRIPWEMVMDRYTTRAIHSIQVVQTLPGAPH